MTDLHFYNISLRILTNNNNLENISHYVEPDSIFIGSYLSQR